jgi:hypothetical protein
MKREKKGKIQHTEKNREVLKDQVKNKDVKIKDVKKVKVNKGVTSITKKANEKNTQTGLFGKYTFLILIVLIFSIAYIALNRYFNGDLLFFFTGIGSDSINQDYPAIMHRYFLQNEPGLSKYSFYIGMGDAYVTNMPIEPYSLIRTLIDQLCVQIMGNDYYVNSRFISIFIYNIFAAGIVFFFYLRTLNIKPYSSLIGALFLTFSGFMMTGAGWGFAGQIFSAVFLLFAFEQLFMKKRWYFFPFAAIYISGNLFNLYIYTLFLLIYFIFRYLYENGKLNKAFFLTAGRMIILGAIGMLMSAERIVAAFMKMYYSPRMAGNASVADQLSNGTAFGDLSNFYPTVILRFFSSDILGNGKSFTGWFNYFEAPAFYIGILTLLIFPQVFIHLEKKKKILFGSFFLFWILSVFVPSLRHLILAYTGDYFRYGFSFFIPFVFLLYSVFALNKLNESFKINIPLLIFTFGILIIALFYPYKSIPENSIDVGIRKVILMLLIIYTGLLVLMSKERYSKSSQILLLIAVVFELSFSSYKSYEKRDALSNRQFKKERAGYNDGTPEAISFIKAFDKTKFYRIEKDYQSGGAEHGSLNDAMAQGYYGSSSYSSFNQLNYVRFLEETELIPKGDETSTRWISGFRNYPLLQTFSNIKYFLSKQEKPAFLNFGYELLKKEGNISILKNKFALPFGYTYDSYIEFDDYKKLQFYIISPQALDNIYLESYARSGNKTESEQIIEELRPLIETKYAEREPFINEIKRLLGQDLFEKNGYTVPSHSKINWLCSMDLSLKRNRVWTFPD